MQEGHTFWMTEWAGCTAFARGRTVEVSYSKPARKVSGGVMLDAVARWLSLTALPECFPLFASLPEPFDFPLLA